MEYANINFKIPVNIKTQLENLCERLGLNLTNYFNMAARAAIDEEGVPFKLRLNDGVDIKEWVKMNESIDKTRAAFLEALDGGLTDKQLNEVMKDLKDRRAKWHKEKKHRQWSYLLTRK